MIFFENVKMLKKVFCDG